MQRDGLVARRRKRYRSTTMSEHDQPIAPNLLARQFDAERPNQRWVGDTTELTTGDGRLFLAVILDLFSRFVVGWALSAVNGRHLTLRALEMALPRRGPDPGLVSRGSLVADGAPNRGRISVSIEIDPSSGRAVECCAASAERQLYAALAQWHDTRDVRVLRRSLLQLLACLEC